jgi:hypothetical protein
MFGELINNNNNNNNNTLGCCNLNTYKDEKVSFIWQTEEARHCNGGIFDQGRREGGGAGGANCPRFWHMCHGYHHSNFTLKQLRGCLCKNRALSSGRKNENLQNFHNNFLLTYLDKKGNRFVLKIIFCKIWPIVT